MIMILGLNRNSIILNFARSDLKISSANRQACDLGSVRALGLGFAASKLSFPKIIHRGPCT